MFVYKLFGLASLSRRENIWNTRSVMCRQSSDVVNNFDLAPRKIIIVYYFQPFVVVGRRSVQPVFAFLSDCSLTFDGKFKFAFLYIKIGKYRFTWENVSKAFYRRHLHNMTAVITPLCLNKISPISYLAFQLDYNEVLNINTPTPYLTKLLYWL